MGPNVGELVKGVLGAVDGGVIAPVGDVVGTVVGAVVGTVVGTAQPPHCGRANVHAGVPLS